MLLVRDDLYVRHVNRVMVTIDGTGVGDDALRSACELVQQIPGGTLTGVHVISQETAPSRGGLSKADELLQAAAQRARSFGVELKCLKKEKKRAKTKLQYKKTKKDMKKKNQTKM